MAGDLLKLTCKVNRVTLSIKWKKNGASDIPRAQIGPRIGKEKTLYIESVIPDDSGVYSCEAHNMAGASSSIVKITVRGKPGGKCLTGLKDTINIKDKLKMTLERL